MTTKRPRRTSTVAPSANWPLVPKPARPPLALVPSEPEPEPEPDLVTVVVTLIYAVDGEAKFNTPLRTQMPRMPADQDAMQLQITLDARQLVHLIEPLVGPTSASVTVAKPGLWAPGRHSD